MEIGKQSECLSIDECIMKMLHNEDITYTHTHIYAYTYAYNRI